MHEKSDRVERVTFLVTPEEKRRLWRTAKDHGMTAGKYIRQCVFRRKEMEVAHERTVEES